MSASIGHDPRSFHWCRTLRGGTTPGKDAPRARVPPLDTGINFDRGKPQSRSRCGAARPLPLRKSKSMLGLANQVRLWRRGDDVSLQRWTLRHWLSLCRTGRLLPLPALPESQLALVAVAAARATRSQLRIALVRWGASSRGLASMAYLFLLFHPHVVRGRLRAALEHFRRYAITERAVSVAACTFAARFALGRWRLHLVGRGEERTLLRLALDAHTLNHPEAPLLSHALEAWRLVQQRVELGRRASHLGFLAGKSSACNRAIFLWRARTSATLRWARCVRLAYRVYTSRALSRGFMCLVAEWTQDGSGSSCCAAERLASLTKRVRHAKQARLLWQLRQRVASAHALDWALLHAKSRGVRHAQRAAFRRWGIHASGGDAVARLARVHQLMVRRGGTTVQRGSQCHLESGCTSMVDVLRWAMLVD
jgi:hypothetical protein